MYISRTIPISREEGKNSGNVYLVNIENRLNKTVENLGSNTWKKKKKKKKKKKMRSIIYSI